MTKIAIVLPAYNAELTLRATVDSIPKSLNPAIILVDDASVAAEADAPFDADPDRCIGGKSDPAHHGEQILTGSDAGPAVAKIARGAFEHRDVPADPAQ